MSSADSGTHNRVLYVGDLHPVVNEQMLFNTFRIFSPHIICEIRRDLNTGESMGYGFITFPTAEQAKLALAISNYVVLVNRPMRLMLKEDNPAKRNNEGGNLFVKNLDVNLSEKELHESLRQFGAIRALKISRYANGKSKGYGFVHFEKEADAKACMEKANELWIANRKIAVDYFKAKKDRVAVSGFKNCFVRNLGHEVDDDGLKEMFAKFGEIMSACVMRDEAGNSRGYGFVCFADSACAQAAVTAMNDTTVNGRQLFVGEAQKKEDRVQLIRKELDMVQNAKFQRSTKIAVLDLDKNITAAELSSAFSRCGTVIEATVVRDEYGCSKGVGLVAFSSPQDVIKALELSGTTLGSKAIRIALAKHPAEQCRSRYSRCDPSNFSSSLPDAANFDGRMCYVALLNQLFCRVRFFSDFVITEATAEPNVDNAFNTSVSNPLRSKQAFIAF